MNMQHSLVHGTEDDMELVCGLEEDMDLDRPTISIIVNEQSYTVGKHILQQSGLLYDIIQQDPNETNIVLSRCEQLTNLLWEKVESYMTYHYNNIPKTICRPLKSNLLQENDVCSWDVDFIDLPYTDVLDLLFISNYLNITTLLQLCAAKIATFMHDKSPEEIKAFFNVGTKEDQHYDHLRPTVKQVMEDTKTFEQSLSEDVKQLIEQLDKEEAKAKAEEAKEAKEAKAKAEEAKAKAKAKAKEAKANI